MIGNKQIKQKGTTLLEIIVAVGIFSVTILLATGIFQSVTDGQRSAMVAQNIQEDVRYAMEIMSREIRMAQIWDDKECFKKENNITKNKIYNTESNAQNKDQNILYFKNESGECVKYFLDVENQLTRGTENSISQNLTPDKVISTKIKITNLKFSISDSTLNAQFNIQPMVTIMLDVEYTGKKMHKQQIKIQTTVSSRYYD